MKRVFYLRCVISKPIQADQQTSCSLKSVYLKMETTKKKHPKKVLHASLSEKLQPLLHDIKETFVVNEKKMEKLVKKAASFLADHLHIGGDKKKVKSKKKKIDKKSAPVKTVAAASEKSTSVKKSAVKKAAPKKAVKKNVKKK
jgi:hypothetical protein